MESTVDQEHLASVIRQVRARKAQAVPAAKSNWCDIIGTAPGDDLDREAAELGKVWREEEGTEGQED